MKAMWVVVCVLVAVVICGPAPGVESFDRLVPEETVVFVSVGDVPEFLARIKETPAYKVLWEGDLFGDLLGDLYAEYPAAAPVVNSSSASAGVSACPGTSPARSTAAAMPHSGCGGSTGQSLLPASGTPASRSVRNA